VNALIESCAKFVWAIAKSDSIKTIDLILCMIIYCIVDIIFKTNVQILPSVCNSKVKEGKIE
jgi:hypothetical protein